MKVGKNSVGKTNKNNPEKDDFEKIYKIDPSPINEHVIDTTAEDITKSEQGLVATDNTTNTPTTIQTKENITNNIPIKKVRPPINCDTTSAIEISTLSEIISFQEIIKNARHICVQYKIAKDYYYSGDEGYFLEESRKTLHELLRSANHLTFHYATFYLEILINLGEILTFVEEYFNEKYPNDNPKRKYIKWENDNFGIQQRRLFQQTKNLYEMGNFAQKYKCIGKNRLLDLYRINKSLNKDNSEDSYNELLNEFPLKDYDLANEFEEKEKNQIYKTLIDACITKARLKEHGIDATYAQAELIALYKRGYITYAEVIDLQEKLKQYGDGVEFLKAFDDYIFNKMSFNSDEGAKSSNPHSISKRLITFIKYIKSIELKMQDPKFLKKQKKYLVREKKLFINARNVINKLIKDFNWGK